MVLARFSRERHFLISERAPPPEATKPRAAPANPCCSLSWAAFLMGECGNEMLMWGVAL